jgi:serine/threonine protein kinase
MAGEAGARSVLFGRFELLRLLGQGAMCSVHAAHDHRLDRLVALKTLLPTVGGASEKLRTEARQRFAAEGDRARQLHHPDIVSILDVGMHTEGAESTAWLAMEAVPGSDLTRYTQVQRLLPDALVLHIAARLADALAHAHAAGIVHRDLKPANVLVHWHTQTLKIVDFGLARSNDSAQSATGLLLGTPAYMAPEQLAGATPSPSTDLYALGIMVFELLTGRRPHVADSMGELLRSVAQEPPVDLRSLRPDLPGALAELLARMLARQPNQRPASAAELCDSLKELGSPGPWQAPHFTHPASPGP